MSNEMGTWLLFASGAAIVGGLGALVRGFGGYRVAALINDTSGSRVSSLAAGEVRLTGVIEPAEVTLISPLQSATCVYYRSSVRQSDSHTSEQIFDEERAVGFRLRDETGAIRVFPRGARWDVPAKLDASTSMFGEEPPGLMYRLGPAVAPGPRDREAQIAALLTVRQPDSSDGLAQSLGVSRSGRSRHYVERRIEPGEIVTVIGQALPFHHIEDPSTASIGGFSLDPLAALDDSEIAADLAEARASGALTVDAATAWGNAAIPGFGIGRPVAQPGLDPAATRPQLATASEATSARELFEIAPDELVLASTDDVRLLVASGAPDQAAARSTGRFLVGLLGAVVAIIGALGLALFLGNALSLEGIPLR